VFIGLERLIDPLDGLFPFHSIRRETVEEVTDLEAVGLHRLFPLVKIVKVNGPNFGDGSLRPLIDETHQAAQRLKKRHEGPCHSLGKHKRDLHHSIRKLAGMGF
jgi:hypothetical protein